MSNVSSPTSRAPRYADVVLNIPLATPLTYGIPPAWRGRVRPGQRVRVPLRHRDAIGLVVGLRTNAAFPRVKPIQAFLDEEPLLPAELLELSQWVAHTYCAGWGETLAAMIPGLLRQGRTTVTPRTPWTGPESTPSQPLTLTAEQEAAARRIQAALDARRHETFLLHGITGSGKTEVYLHAISRALQQGHGSIVLVPEIALTPQAIARFTARFGPDQVAVLHSGMRESHRLQHWHRVAQGQARIVIGARSAIFAPVHQLGLIVVDEEQESTYKQDEVPRYHARDVAIERGRQHHAVVILGSATPSLEAYARARRGLYTLLELTHRIDQRPLPTVQIVDVQRLAFSPQARLLSPPLERALEATLAEGQQAIVLLNRRGFATFVQCTGCGAVARCPDCQVTLTFHQAGRQLVCHHCQRRQPVPERCPTCEGRYVKFRGTGTQRVESELARHFPTARIARMDSDAMRPHGSHERILAQFHRGEIDILIGTQMVAKGHDFPQVTLIGVINADTALHLPDFRAAERTFSLLTQVAGRAGRGSLPGRVIVQTSLPKHEAIVAASRHDYAAFARAELAHRRALQLPPLTAMAQITVRAPREPQAREAAEALVERLQRLRRPAATLLGPAPSPWARLRRLYRWQLIVTARTREALLTRLAPIRGLRRLQGAQILIDVDPWNPW